MAQRGQYSHETTAILALAARLLEMCVLYSSKRCTRTKKDKLRRSYTWVLIPP